MKLLRIAAVAALIFCGGIALGTSAVNAAPATGLLGGASGVRTLAAPAQGALVEKTYYYRRYYWHRRHYWHRYHYRHPYYRHYYRRHYWHRYYW